MAEDSAAQINASLGLAYMREGKFDLALDKLQRSLQQDPNLAAAHHYIAELFRHRASYDLAEQHYRRAIELAPKDPALLNNYGVFLCDRGRYNDAERRFLASAKLHAGKTTEEAYENAGLCALRVPDPVKAQGYFRRALEINPALPKSLFQMARISRESGHYLWARAFLQRYHAVTGPSAQSLWLGVQIERRLGDQESLDRYAKSLREQFPQAEETQMLLDSQTR